MIGTDDSSPGRTPEVADEDILNVIRQSDNEEIPIQDILEDDAVTIGYEGLRKRLKKLSEQGRVESRKSGRQTVLWRLGELESEEPVRSPGMAKAHRRSNFLKATGKMYFFLAFGLLFASIIAFILFLHGQAGQVNPPILSEGQVLFGGYLLGYGGAIFGVLFGVFYGAAIVLPKVVAWRLGRSTTNQQNEQ